MRREEELRLNLHEVRAQISAACSNRPEPTLIVVTKTWPASDVRILAELGVRDVGENRDQEAAPKRRECDDLDLRWHCIGQLQTNKAKSVATWADVLHSVDRLSLVTALARAVADRPSPLECLIQVNLDGDGGQGTDTSQERGGAAPSQVLELADHIAGVPGLVLRGVMGVAPLHQSPGPAFAALAKTSQAVVAQYPDATWISAGMSGDWETALENGATHLRLGSTVLGNRH